MESYEKLSEAHVQHLQKLIPAFQALYDAMPPDQQKVADQAFRASAQARGQTQAQSAGNQGGPVRTARVTVVRHYFRPRHEWGDNSMSAAEELNSEELQRLGAAPR
jgi:hypothetical protein